MTTRVVAMATPVVVMTTRVVVMTTQTDGVHSQDNKKSSSAEALSEGIKLLKAQYLVKAISALKMDQAIIFCRTKLDCDNIEAYLVSLGGGQRSKYKGQLCTVCMQVLRRW